MFEAAAGDPDWFVVRDPQIIKRLIGIPTIRARHGVWQLHRSLLPVLSDVSEAQRLIMPVNPDLRCRKILDERSDLLGYRLRPHQHAAREFILKRRGTLLGDDMRVGKTLAALSVHDLRDGPLLIVCPLFVREVWLTWIARVFPEIPVGVMASKVYDPEVAWKPIVVCHYDILPYWQLVRPYGTVIFDEAHYLSNHRSKRTRAANLLASRGERVIALTGTPIWNRPIGLHPILGLICPGAFGSRKLFGERYCGPVPTAHGTRYEGISNEDELTARLSTVMLRRLWVDIQSDLPPITRDIALVEVSLAQQRQIDFAVAAVRLGSGGSLAKFRRALGAMKAKPTIELARTILDRGEPVVVWAWHRDIAKAIAKGLGDRAVLIHGEIPQTKREALLTQWRAGPLALVVTIATLPGGVDLSHAHLGIFAEVDWTPAMISQAEMRTYDPTRAMHLTYVVADHLVERQLVVALHSKLGSSAPIGAAVAGDAIDILLTVFNDGAQTPDMERLARDLLSADFTFGGSMT